MVNAGIVEDSETEQQSFKPGDWIKFYDQSDGVTQEADVKKVNSQGMACVRYQAVHANHIRLKDVDVNVIFMENTELYETMIVEKEETQSNHEQELQDIADCNNNIFPLLLNRSTTAKRNLGQTDVVSESELESTEESPDCKYSFIEQTLMEQQKVNEDVNRYFQLELKKYDALLKNKRLEEQQLQRKFDKVCAERFRATKH